MSLFIMSVIIMRADDKMIDVYSWRNSFNSHQILIIILGRNQLRKKNTAVIIVGEYASLYFNVLVISPLTSYKILAV